MQIHELTQPKKSKLDEAEMFGPGGLASEIGSAWRNKGTVYNPKDMVKSLLPTKSGAEARQRLSQAQADADQREYARTATTAAGKLQAQLALPPTLNQALSKLSSNPGAQQWIDSIVAQWPAVATELANTPATPATSTNTTPATPTTAAKTTPATPTAQSVTLGGKKLDPKNPNDAQVLAAMNKQGIKEAPEYTTPGGIVVPGGAKTAVQTNTQAYADKFRSWANGQLKTTNLATLENNPEVKAKLESLLQKIVAAKDDPQAQQKLVHDFFSTAVAANHVVQASNPQARPTASVTRPATTSQEKVDTGLTDTQVYFLSQAARKAGGPAPGSTGNKFYDSLIQQIRGG